MAEHWKNYYVWRYSKLIWKFIFKKWTINVSFYHHETVGHTPEKVNSLKLINLRSVCTHVYLEDIWPLNITAITALTNITAWKVFVFGVILVRIFPRSDWIQIDTPCISVFSPNERKCWPELLRILTLLTQCINIFRKAILKHHIYITVKFQESCAVV